MQRQSQYEGHAWSRRGLLAASIFVCAGVGCGDSGGSGDDTDGAADPIDAAVADADDGGSEAACEPHLYPAGEFQGGLFYSTTDCSGNVISLHQVAGTMDFGGGAHTDAVLLVAFGPDRSFLWERELPAGIFAGGVAADCADRIYIVGRYTGSVDFGGGARTGDQDLFVLALDAAGDYVWDRTFDTAPPDPSCFEASCEFGIDYDVSVDGSGHVLATAPFYGAVDFGGGSRASAGELDVVVLSLDANGDYRWDRTLGGGLVDFPGGIAAGPNDEVTTTGWSSDGIYVARYDVDGNDVWSSAFGDPSGGYVEVMHEGGRDVGVDAEGNVVVGGTFTGDVDFGGGVRSGTKVGFALGLDADGEYAWDVTVAESRSCVLGVAVASDGTSAVVAYEAMSSPTAGRGTFLGLAADGTESWRVTHSGITTEEYVRPNGIVGTGDGEFVSTGTAVGNIDLGAGEVNAGAGAAFLLPLCP